MLIRHNPDDYVVETKTHICDYHKRQPWDTNWPGCTCSSSYFLRRATSKEKAENLKRRKEELERRRKHIVDYDAGRLK